MKLNKDFILRQVADTWVVLSIGEKSIDFNGMLTLNETGKFLWRQLEQGADCEKMVAALTNEYVVTREQAMEDVQRFIKKLVDFGCIDEDE